MKSAYTRSVGKDVAESIADEARARRRRSKPAGRSGACDPCGPERYYKPFSVTLLKTTHDVYPGTITASESLKASRKISAAACNSTTPATGEKR